MGVTERVPDRLQLQLDRYPLVRPAAALVAAGLVTAFVGAVDPNQPGHYPTCPFLLLTGHWCPGCGSLRALHALAHGHLGEALARNPLMVASIPLLAALWLLWARRAATRSTREWAAPGWAIWGLLAVVVAFWVLRNLPGFAWLAP